MYLLLKFSLVVSLLMVSAQDTKERKVYWFLFPIIALCSGVLLYNNMLSHIFYLTIGINYVFVLLLMAIVFLYSKYKLKTSMKNTFGLGDGLLFFALTFTFSNISFLILFVFSLIFSLALHLILKKHSKFRTVPLAGYISLFFSITYLFHWLGFLPSLYSI